jgi:glycosyltransferase involved in cell wall biosynthesis
VKIEYSIVIPCYKSTSTLVELSSRIKEVYRKINKTYEIIFINDGSPDISTWNTLKNLSSKDSNVVLINLTRNFGQQSATMCGFRYCKGEYVITMDDDLQHEPESISILIGQNHHDIVIARLRNRQDHFLRQITSRIKSYFDYIVLGKPKNIRLSPFRLFRKEVIDNILKMKSPSPFIPALMFYVTKDVVNVDVEHKSREIGKSNYTLIKRIKLFSLIVINNSSLILKLVGYVGIISAMSSFILISYFLIAKWFFTAPPLGWTSILSSILFFGGLCLFSIGIVGEYLIRIIPVVENKQPFIVKEIIGLRD